jgi:hypothetical protein
MKFPSTPDDTLEGPTSFHWCMRAIVLVALVWRLWDIYNTL